MHVAFCLVWHPTMLCCPAYIVCMLVPFIVSCLWLTTVVCMTVVRFQRPDETADRVLFAPDHFLLSEYPSSVAIEVGRKKITPSTMSMIYCTGQSLNCCYWLLLLSGDIQVNPGRVEHSCTMCKKPVKRDQWGICCDTCDEWSHARCLGMKTEECDLL